MIEFTPYIFQISLSLGVGLVAIFLYTKSRKLGLALISIAFFLSAVPSIVHLALGGPYPVPRLLEQGYTAAEIGVFYFYSPSLATYSRPSLQLLSQLV
jgi:hypothetical protein